jgi:uncharacterized protein YkwD
MQRLFVLLSCLGTMFFAGCGSSALDTNETGPDANGIYLNSTLQTVLDLTNAERANYGLSPLTWNEKLAQAADAHCLDMATRNYFDHNSPEGTTPADRVNATGYLWTKIAENLGKGYPTPQEVVAGWMSSSGHRANILDPDYTELGIGLRYTSGGYPYWAQEFGLPR